MNFSFISSLFSDKSKKNDEEVTSISSLAPKVLTKKEDIDKIRPYLDKLGDTLKAKGINNIALTGGYGSGKSTILKTFQHWNKKEYKFLNISLAAFNQTKSKENFKELYELKIKNGKTEKEAEKEIANEFKETLINNEELERRLEISILQQIVYKVKPSNLPESRFKRIINIPKWKLRFLFPIGFILWLSSIVILYKYNYLDKLNPNTWILSDSLDWSSIFVFLISFLGIGYSSKLVIELFSNSKINKVNLKGEIEIGDNSNKSILNEHYDEILYYFEKNSYNVVVIEDLDRFDNTNIFTKLRELNILLNNADTIKNKKSYRKHGIKFLYAVGDDLFNDKKERVKFFDYIIPVIPFINSYNADEPLINLIKESGLEENIFPKEFLSDITTFIDDIDMRLLINIFHEFVIYRNVLKPEFIKKPEELFAIITYKNVDPEDFNKLNNNDGKLYNLISNKEKYIKKYVEENNNKIVELRKQIKNINNENISDIKDLRRIYINQILTKLPNTPIYISEINIESFLVDKGFNCLIENGEIEYNYLHKRYYGPITDTLIFSFEEIEKEVNPNFTYKERVNFIESKFNNRVELLQKEIEKLEDKKIEIQNWDLKQIFKDVDINHYLKDFSNNGLLRNLVLEGYINENYNDYISLFHGISLTKEDKIFERNVKSGIDTYFNYKLTHIENLIDNHLELKYFDRETILNFDLLDLLGNKYDEYSKQYDNIIKLLSSEKERSIEFIDQYIEDENRPLKIFIQILVEMWKGFWEYVYDNYSFEKQFKYLRLIIDYSEVESILKYQNKDKLKEAFEEKIDFIKLIKTNDETDYYIELKNKVSEIIKSLNIKFNSLDIDRNNIEKLFNYIYFNNHYKINKDNIFRMISIFGEKNVGNTFETSNYSTIHKSNCKPLVEYITSNINTYVENVYLKLEQNKFEDVWSLLLLLNNEKLEDKLKIKIIQKVETVIPDLSIIKEIGIKDLLLINNSVIPVWGNIINYYTSYENTVNEILVEFLNSEYVYLALANEKMPHKSETFDYSSFRKNLLLCNEISDDSYVKLFESSIYTRESLSFENLSENKIEYLTNKILTTTKSNYDLLRENFPNNHITLIENDFTKFIENINDFETDEGDILLILKSNKITIDNKFNYISKLEEKTIIDSKDISKLVGDIILLKSEMINFKFETLQSIIVNSNSNENKIRLINLYFSRLNDAGIVNLVGSINWNYKELFKKQHKPKFSDFPYKRELFENLESRGLIKSFHNDKKDKSKIRVIANY
ncbi:MULTISPECIES: hypothetical protein [Apibacter]|uniref:YobI family P-loop NTPase n=1 Tax=Apibacter TaxID=1778601 RepID=UPI001C6A529B|nr:MULTISPECIES: hypothetical protein [Apibacter]QYN50271.1 hypothetical protein GYM72_01470 [Apibacter sp. ESL0404]